MDCGCGRSPTGKCIGWHDLSEEQQEELKKWDFFYWYKYIFNKAI